jgi:hypothetical protein
VDGLAEFGREAVALCLVVHNGTDRRLEARSAGPGWDSPLRPASGGGTALIPAITPQQEGLQPVLGSLEIPDGSAQARVRARLASASAVGTPTGVRVPERRSRARWVASRRSVLTRSPACFGTREGATSQPRRCCLVRSR